MLKKIQFILFFLVFCSFVSAIPVDAKMFSVASLSSSNFGSKLKIKYSSQKSVEAKSNNTTQTQVKIETINTPTTTNQNSGKIQVSIPKINLNNVDLVSASVVNLPDLDNKMLYNPIIDSLTSEPCLEKKSTYILGHSEPAYKSMASKPAARIFKDVELLRAGDIIEMQNSFGNKCKYTVIGSEIVGTASDDTVSTETFNRLYFPQVKDSSILTVQTCVKGSATRRLIVTAIMN